ncbi:MAG: Asp-tRNA(Asn)/Glu-tRNA(Gln) amidotransferase subunit GatA [bacterium]|nr:Asp-tRNA(Asn)/Glu-tRNA(Gln) amidotransferase subunit GatA [bacterium]
MNLNELTIKQASEKLANKEISSVELTKACLERIKATDDKLHAFLSMADELALEAAKQADKQIANNTNSVLTGIPYAVKDNILVKGTKTTAASKILENYESAYNATVIDKLNLAGPVMVGKTNLDEFAMGASTENSAFGPTKNPHDLERVPGGSSGGSAAAVAADQVLFALGSDTAGSIRQPASFCGVVGLKPTYGRVSRYGLIAMCSSLDQIGVLTKTVEDAALSLQLIAGQDEFDTTSLPKPVPDYSKSLNKDVKGIKIGVPKEFFIEGLDKEVEQIVRTSIQKLEKLGAEIIEVSLPNIPYSVATYYIITPVEISANLSRFDGIRYGLSVPGKSLEEVYYNSRSVGLGPETKRRIMIGTYASSAGYFDAYYKKAKEIQTLIRDDFNKVFEKVDLLITPVSPHPAFKIGEKADPLSMYLEDVFTGPLNLSGVPGLSMPAGATKDGLPVNVQLIAPHFQEEKLILVGDALEKQLNFKLKPKL